jgi:hypothetical protein
MFFTYLLLNTMPLTSSFGAWYGRPSALTMTLVLGLATVGFWFARGRAPLFGKPLIDD